MIKHFKGFTGYAFLASSMFTIIFAGITQNIGSRSPASLDKVFELELQQISLNTASNIKKLDGAYIKATFNKTDIVEFSAQNRLSLQSGESRKLGLKIDIRPEWIKDNQLEFKIEVVKQGLIESVVARCSQVSKEVRDYSRTYQCTLPGETSPILSYRLGEKAVLTQAAIN